MDAIRYGWKFLSASAAPNDYILEGGVNNWIRVFGKEDETLAARPKPEADDDELAFSFPVALGDKYDSCSPSPVEYENLDFEAKIKLQLKRDKSGGGCG